jgi:hypothetical protein
MAEAEIDWRTRPYVSVKEAAKLLTCSTSMIYVKLRDETLQAVDLLGKTAIATSSIRKVLDAAQPKMLNSGRVAASVAARLRRKRSRTAEPEAQPWARARRRATP